jgi:hypothetical protein
MKKFIIGQNEREETTQDTIVTKSAACAIYKSNYVTHVTDAHRQNLLLVKMKEKKLLKIQSLPKVLRSQAMRNYLTYITATYTRAKRRWHHPV